MIHALVGGTIVDGSGRPGYRGDVLMADGVLTAVGSIEKMPPGAVVHDITGKWVTPGFIDVHSHGDDAPLLPQPDPSKVLQGITSEVVGNCGFSIAPRSAGHAGAMREYVERIFTPPGWAPSDQSFAELLAATDAAGYVTNYAPLVGHGTLRIATVGLWPGVLTHAELQRMVDYTNEAMTAGAVGLSSGLIYPPGSFADLDELVAVATVAAHSSGVYASHIRAEGRGRMAAVAEALTIGQRSGARVQISHHKAKGQARWGGVAESIAAAADARARGIEVGFDVYPYAASSTTLAACLPPDLFALDDAALIAQLQVPECVSRLRAALADPEWDNHVYDCGGFDGVLIAGTADGRFVGKTLADVAAEQGTDGAGALVHVLLAEQLRAGMVCFAMSEADVRQALSASHTCIGSDSTSDSSGHLGHPRARGTFARVLGHYARDEALFSMEEAVRKMTSVAAQWFRLDHVGEIQPGYAADLVVLDPTTIVDAATYTDPARYPVGVHEVFVSGHHVVRNGVYSGQRAGRRLRHRSADRMGSYAIG